MSHRGRKPAKILIHETHEPATPNDWPNGHVGVELTPDDVEECVKVRIHEVQHYLHSTTARELSLDPPRKYSRVVEEGFEPL